MASCDAPSLWAGRWKGDEGKRKVQDPAQDVFFVLSWGATRLRPRGPGPSVPRREKEDMAFGYLELGTRPRLTAFTRTPTSWWVLRTVSHRVPSSSRRPWAGERSCARFVSPGATAHESRPSRSTLDTYPPPCRSFLRLQPPLRERRKDPWRGKCPPVDRAPRGAT